MKLNDQQKELIERFGVFHEQMGMQPVVGRIMGYLLLSDAGEATFQDFVDDLGISKSAVSNSLNVLQAMNVVDYITKPGDRKRYFRLKKQSFREILESQITKLLKVRELFILVLENRNIKDNEMCQRLHKLTDYFEFMSKEIPQIADRFETKPS